MTSAVSAVSVKRQIDGLLDQGFEQTVGPALASISNAMNSGLMQTRTAQLKAEAKRLADLGEPMKPDNPVLRAYMADLQDALKRARAQIDGVSDQILHTSIDAANRLVPQLALAGDAALFGAWNHPDPMALAKILQYVTSPEWEARLDQFTEGIADSIANIAFRGIASGRGPLAIASDIANASDEMALYQARSLMRTLQLTGYRDASVMQGLANADILDSQIRIAVLDNRTCMACVVLNGQEMDIGERVDDHDQGRCTSIYVVKGRTINIESGEDWFNRQSADRQETMMGGAAYAAWKAGEFDLSDYPQPYTDPLFGDMIREASLKGMIGDAAQNYYKTNRN